MTCTMQTSSIPSQWFGLVNLSSFSGPHALAPEPQLMMFRIMMPVTRRGWHQIHHQMRKMKKNGVGWWDYHQSVEVSSELEQQLHSHSISFETWTLIIHLKTIPCVMINFFLHISFYWLIIDHSKEAMQERMIWRWLLRGDNDIRWFI